ERMHEITESAGFGPRSRHSLPGRGSNDQDGGRSSDLARRLVALGRQRAERWGWVNTYTYAKSLGEQIIAAEQGLDYAIVRPAIVESALDFPFPVWFEGSRIASPMVLMTLGCKMYWPEHKT